MCGSYEKHTGEGRSIDQTFVKEAIESGYWQKIQDGGMDALLNMLVEITKTIATPTTPSLLKSATVKVKKIRRSGVDQPSSIDTSVVAVSILPLDKFAKTIVSQYL